MSDPEPIDRLNRALKGRYEIDRELGEGGMATVYLADDLKHERKVALKVLKPELAAAVGTDRFLAEIRTTANLQHPHILPLHDSGEADGLLFYIMPYVDGESLRQRLERERQLPLDDALRITSGVASALHHAHGKNVIHRDIKPANVMLSDGFPVVADFGISLAVEQAGVGRITGSGFAMGTPAYMSPEQGSGEETLDPRTDIYALGCVLYELLTGELPHAGSTMQAIIAKRLTIPPTPVRTLRPSVPEHVDEAIRQALEVVPADRFQTAEDFRRALRSGKTPEHLTPFEGLRTPTSPTAPDTTPFVGRAKEREELLERLDLLEEGRGSLVVIGGEPGVGKTRLSELLLEAARERRYLTVVGHAYELEGTPPFTPYIEQLEYTARVVRPDAFRAVLGDAAPDIARIWPGLRGLFPDIGPGIELPPDQLRLHLFHRYREFVERACRVSPIVVLFDDLHWADEASLLLLEHLGQHLHDLPCLILGTYRDVELEVGRPFAASLERLLRQHRAHRISLRRLPRDEVAALFESLGGSEPPAALVEAVHHETEGNPFFVQEVFRHLDEEGVLFDEDGAWRPDAGEETAVPEGVRLVVGRRLARTSDACRKVLTTASVVGPRFALAVLDAVGDVEEDDFLDAIEEAEAAHLIQSVGRARDPVYGFTHELIRQTLIEGLSLPRRQRRHRKIAAAIEATYGRRIEEHASDMAHHLYQAGAGADPDETLRFLKLAGDQALDGSGYEEALAQYERALSLEEDVPEALMPELLSGKTRALDGMGRWTEMIDSGRAAIDLYVAHGRGPDAAPLAEVVCNRLAWHVDNRAAKELGGHVVAALPAEARVARVRVECQVALTTFLAGDENGWEILVAAAEEAEQLGDPSTATLAKYLRIVAMHNHARPPEVVRIADDALAALDRGGDQSLRTQVEGLRAMWLPSIGRGDEAVAACEAALALGRERGDVGCQIAASFGLLDVLVMSTGDGRRFETASRAHAEAYVQAGPWGAYGLLYAAMGRLWQGDVAGAWELADEVVDDATDLQWSTLARASHFELAAYAERPESLELFARLKPELCLADTIAWSGNVFAIHTAIVGLAWLGEVEEAATLYPAAVDTLENGVLGRAVMVWAGSAGIAAACAGEWAHAERLFETAIRQSEEMPHVMSQVDSRRWFAWALLLRNATGDRERAAGLLHQAIDGYEKLESPFFADHTKRLLERAGS